jgi:hypothetical protein
VKHGRHVQQRGNLAHGATVLESQRKKETVNWIELGERRAECVRQLPAPESIVWARRCARDQAIRVYFAGEKILELTSRDVLGAPSIIRAT